MFRRIFEPNIPENATQEQIAKSVFTEDFKFLRYEIVGEHDLEPADVKVIILKASEGESVLTNFDIWPVDVGFPNSIIKATIKKEKEISELRISKKIVQYNSIYKHSTF